MYIYVKNIKKKKNLIISFKNRITFATAWEKRQFGISMSFPIWSSEKSKFHATLSATKASFISL